VSTTWTHCPECNCGPGDEHKLSCSMNPYKAPKYRAQHIQDPRFVDGVCVEDTVRDLLKGNPKLVIEPKSADIVYDKYRGVIFGTTEEHCPGHVASSTDPKICAYCGVHIDSLRPPDEGMFKVSEMLRTDPDAAP
jgi:hypothetical protein